MKPDLDDYEELNDDAEAPRGRAMSWLVLGIAVAGFASLAYYAYHSGSATPGGEVMVVIAEQGDIKRAPEVPGGEEFPNKDKTIYDVIAKDETGASAQGGEKLLPEPQQPVINNNPGDHEDDDVDALVANAAKTPASPAAAAAPAPVTAAPAAPAPEAKPEAPATTTYVSKTLAPAAEDAAVKAPGEPTIINEKLATAKKDEPKTAAAAPAAKPEVKKEAKKAEPKKEASKPAAAPVAGGSYKVQLGAYASESEAQGAWKKITGAHAGVLSGGPTIVKAEVNGKTYYRLRAGSFADGTAAKAACAKLAGQACLPVK